MHVFLHLYKYYYILCNTIYYILLYITIIFHFMYRTFISIYSKTKMKRNKKKLNLYIYIDIFFICRNKNTRIKILLNDIVFVYPWIVRSIESQPLDVHLISFPTQYFLHEIHIWMSRAM